MKKQVAKTIREYAEKLPLVFEWEEDVVVMKGWELKLTPYGDFQDLDDDSDYEIPVPAMRAVLHEQQMKDAYKRYGFNGVADYIRSIANKI